MSDRCSDSPTTSTASPVEEPAISHSQNDEYTPSVLHPTSQPPSRPKPITNPTTPLQSRPSGRVSPSNKLRRASTFAGDHVPQLSERDSIWSTHYLPSDPSSPERAIQSTSSERNDDLAAPVIQNVSPNSGLSLSSVGSLRQSAPFSLRPKQSSLTQRLTGSKFRDGLPPVPPDSNGGAELQQGSMATSVSSDNHSDDRPRRSTEESRRKVDEGPTGRPVSNLRRERSASRGRAHVEKSIEATLASAETAKNARSRKSSHYMGLFKDNTRPQESQKKDGRSAEINTHKDDNANEPRALTRSPVSLDTEGTSNEPGALQEDIRRQNAPQDKTKLSSPIKAEQASLHDEEEDPTTPVASLRPMIPPDLLQEIRQQHSLTSLEPATAGQSRSLPDPRVLQSVKHTGEEEQRMVNARGRGDDEDEEHISAAVYYPHAGHAQEDLDAFEALEQRPQDRVEKIEALPRLPKPREKQGRKSFAEPVPAEHVDISLQSKNEKSVFHGDYQPQSDVADDEDRLSPIEEQAFEGFSSSASEYETDVTDEESSVLEESETTPTATPVPTAAISKHRERLESAEEPKNAVMLQPYSHQVGGHSTVFQFSRQAVCKKLNNRENQFYERIEQRHPDMLRFLPKYLGVLNVTFTKGPKRIRALSAGRDSQQQQQGGSQHVGVDKLGEHPIRGNSSLAVENRDGLDTQRIVSQSQQIGEVPQVILNQNRHIVPFSLFGSPERPKSADPASCQRHQSLLPKAILDNSVRAPSNGIKSEDVSPLRPAPPEHSNSWGTTTVNSKLREQVLREVFGPPLIHRQKRHARAHNTLPRLRVSSNHKRTNLSESRINEDHQADPRSWNRPTMIKGMSTIEDSTKNKGPEEPSMPFSSSASAFEDLNSQALGRIKTTGSDDSGKSDAGGRRLKRRHSGTGLRRRRDSITDSKHGTLEYFEENGYGGDGEDEVFRMDDERGPANGVLPKSESASISTGLSGQMKDQQSSSKHNGDTGIQRLPTLLQSPVIEHLPSNPKEAQSLNTLTNAEQRVEYFLLLEDLTAGMGRPCVLDLKMGTRQYGIEADKKKRDSQRRKCRTTTSEQLGVRICGMQTFNVKKQQQTYEDKYYGRDLKAGREFREALTRFLYDGVSYQSVARHIPTILDKLSKLESMVRKLPGYRFYASSLLLLYDAEPEKSRKAISETKRKLGTEDEKKSAKWPPPIDIKIVDFANCVTGEDPIPPDAPCPPQHPNDVDRGYLRGLRTLRLYFQRILKDIEKDDKFTERGEEASGGMRNSDKSSSDPTWLESVIEEDPGEVSV